MPLMKPEIRLFVENGSNKDYKTLLQQIVQQERGELLEYVITGEKRLTTTSGSRLKRDSTAMS